MKALPPMPSGQDYASMGPVDNYGAATSSTGVLRFLVFLRRHWWVPMVTLLLGLAGAAAYVHWKPPVFVSSAAMWETEKLHLEGGALSTDEGENYIGTQIELLKSGKLRQEAMERLQASNTNSIPLGKDGAPLDILLSFKEAPKSAVFVITASSADPAFSQNFLDALMNEYLDYKKTVRRLVSGETAASISQQVESLERDLKNAQDALTSFQRTNNLAILEEEGTVAGGYLAKLETQLSDLKLESQILDATAVAQNLTNADNGISMSDYADVSGSLEAPSGSANSSGHTTAFQDLALLKMQRAELSKYLRPKHPKIVSLDQQIARAEALVEMYRHQGREQLAASQQSLKMKINSVVNSIKEWQSKVVEANARIAEAEHLKLNVTRTQSIYDRLAALLQNVDISRNTDLETVAILEPASPATPSHRQTMMAIIAAVFGGLAVGVGIVFLIEKRDDRFTSVVEVHSVLGDAIVGLLPEMSPNGKEPMRLLELNDARHGYAESYRSLRSALFFLPTEGERPKLLLITSAMPNEGKSTIAANLARTLALSGSRVLLVDGDLRKGHLHRSLNLQSEPGLADLLHDTCEPDRVIQRDSLPSFAFVACGAHLNNPGDLFLGSGLDQVLARWRREFDYVIIDSSPLFAADDASCLAPKMDGTLFVVRRGQSSARAVSEALDLLARRQARVLGVVYNGADASARSYHYYKYADYNKAAKSA
jgi:polysaccharide biosynthesis transport protein